MHKKASQKHPYFPFSASRAVDGRNSINSSSRWQCAGSYAIQLQSGGWIWKKYAAFTTSFYITTQITWLGVPIFFFNLSFLFKVIQINAQKIKGILDVVLKYFIDTIYILNMMYLPTGKENFVRLLLRATFYHNVLR